MHINDVTIDLSRAPGRENGCKLRAQLTPNGKVEISLAATVDGTNLRAELEPQEAQAFAQHIANMLGRATTVHVEHAVVVTPVSSPNWKPIAPGSVIGG